MGGRLAKRVDGEFSRIGILAPSPLPKISSGKETAGALAGSLVGKLLGTLANTPPGMVLAGGTDATRPATGGCGGAIVPGALGA